MNVLVTGATGGIGSWVVDSLAADNHDVVGVDLRRPPGERANVRFLGADLTDHGQARELIQTARPDAVVHCAGIPRMGERPGAETFRVNAMAAYNVFVAAGTVDADVVYTSSESLYGMPYADPPFLPDYLPIDEAHPKRPADPYGASKLVSEHLARMAVRKYDISVASLRPSWVNYPGDYDLTAVRDGFDPETAARSGNFWSYVDIRDVVSLVEAALAADIDGHEAYLAVAAENYLGRPTAETIETVFGDLPDRCGLEGEASAFSTAKARTDLGWEPVHSWREAVDEALAGPKFV
ncbi:NAD-dependent epimerase/dehydratase family protein [Halorhabdus salina]|uniref:NAD-dependent epimerase/dehydratase family protein n=1 Tax=Halorhabdus salina TaxID=2750670 RepID=UPI0015EE50C9|nr:NAD(P)-dependent oxidoreductase [Halorhabdus salina]